MADERRGGVGRIADGGAKRGEGEEGRSVVDESVIIFFWFLSLFGLLFLLSFWIDPCYIVLFLAVY